MPHANGSELPTQPPIDVKLEGDRMITCRGDIEISVARDRLGIAHLGCGLLWKPSVRKALTELIEEQDVSETLGHWDSSYPGWRSTKDAIPKLGDVLSGAARQVGTTGLDLVDTMQGGSDYYRPGKLLTQIANELRRDGLHVGYAREDALCPPRAVLDDLISGKTATFGEYADRYAEHVRRPEIVDLALHVIASSIALDRLPVFLCVDPYAPDLLPSSQLLDGTAWTKKAWRSEHVARVLGCHRVVLVAELFLAVRDRYGVELRIFELDPMRCQTLHRS